MELLHSKRIKSAITALVLSTALATSAMATSVTANHNANVRSQATTSSKAVAVIKEGASRTVLGTSGNWVRIKVNGKVGYVHTNNLTTSMSSTKTTTTGACALRSQPSKDSSKVRSVKKGTSVTMTGTSGSWVKVKVGSSTGFIHSNYLKGTFYNKVCTKAKSLLGSSYVYGATGPNSFDCSGFTQYLYNYSGKSIPRTAESQYYSAKKVSKSNLKPGYLVFFSSSSGGGVGHVGVYVGNGNMVHAANSSTGVVTTSLSSSYYTSHYVGAGYY